MTERLLWLSRSYRILPVPERDAEFLRNHKGYYSVVCIVFLAVTPSDECYLTHHTPRHTSNKDLEVVKTKEIYLMTKIAQPLIDYSKTIIRTWEFFLSSLLVWSTIVSSLYYACNVQHHMEYISVYVFTGVYIYMYMY